MRKKSGKKASEIFKKQVRDIEEFLGKQNLSTFSDAHISWAHDYAIIRLYREFEDMILNCLIAAINGNTQHLSKTTGVNFPKHITDEVCEYIIVGDRFFNFRGRDGLIKTLKKYLPDNHYLVTIVKKPAYKDALERLTALRNFAAHDSKPSKKHALQAVGGQRLASSGAWLKTQNRFKNISASLMRLANEVQQRAPY
ncbi:MAG: hypothetical protein F4Y53_03175 [Proteobacteria bacterium]|nr:hypothetical protein [Pseudomonadota bacterium]